MIRCRGASPGTGAQAASRAQRRSEVQGYPPGGSARGPAQPGNSAGASPRAFRTSKGSGP
jgi:hypothetical protein